MRGFSEGGITRALVWVLGGVIVAFGLVVLVSPELLRADPGFLTGLLGLVSIAVVPGLLVLGYAAIRRRRLDVDEADAADARRDAAPGRGTHPPRRPSDPEQTP